LTIVRLMNASSPRILALFALVALVAAGCGSSNSSSSSTSGSGSSSGSGSVKTEKKDAAIAAQVPAAFKGKTLRVASDASYPPNEFIKSGSNGTVIGMDPDLVTALGQVMGLKVQVRNATFDGIIPGIQAKKYDVGASSFTDNKEREKTVDFVTYLSAGTAFYVKAQGGPNIGGLADLCGHKVAVEKGTTQQTDSAAQSKKCTSSGKKGVTVLTFPDQNGANLALSSGRADVVMADSPPAEYAVKQGGGQFKLTGKVYGTAPYGLALPKNSGLDKPMLAALKKTMADGTYLSILKKWGIEAGAIKNPTINGATS
jgi:polar amino acid transport system substrate-binding protein